MTQYVHLADKETDTEVVFCLIYHTERTELSFETFAVWAYIIHYKIYEINKSQ